MRPLAALAGGIGAACAMGIAHGQTTGDTRPGAVLLGEPLSPPIAGRLSFSERSDAFPAGVNFVRQNVSETSRRAGPGAVDTLRLTRAQSGIPLADPASLRDEAYAVDYARTWPGAVRRTAGRYQIDVSPQARFGYGPAGGSVGAGAMVSVSRPSSGARLAQGLEKLGFADGSSYGDRGRFYLFAAGSGRAVGFNVAPGGAPNGWTNDPTAVVGDAQAGVGWRKGDVQTSFGYTVRRVRVEDPYARRFIDYPRSDEVVGLSFSYKPSR